MFGLGKERKGLTFIHLVRDVACTLTEALAFNVFGTLLDTAGVAKALASVTSQPEALAATWRAKQLEYTFLLAAMDRYLPFKDVTARALRQAAAIHGVRLTASQERAAGQVWTSLSPFRDVRPTLKRLRGRCPLAAVSNGDPEVVEQALHNVGLDAFLNPIISAAEVWTFKPSKKVYTHAAKRIGLSIANVALVSANAFDVMGAKAAGMRAIWVNRAGGRLDEVGLRPDNEISSLRGL